MLEVTGQILLIPPFYENFGKRLVKTPKLYFADSGLLCHLLGIPDEMHQVFFGALGIDNDEIRSSCAAFDRLQEGVRFSFEILWNP